MISTAQDALEKNLSLGAPGMRPEGGHFLTKGGVQVTAQVTPLLFVKEQPSSQEEEEGGKGDRRRKITGELENSTTVKTSANAIEELVQQLDSKRGVLLSSSYEFPGR